jgi:hypothetical protein
MAIFLTYDNRTLQDGLGAQALRITGIYALAKTFGLRYSHSPIIHVIEDVGQDPDGDPTQNNLISSFNNFFNFPSDRMPKANAIHINIRDFSLRALARLIFRYTFYTDDVVVTILLPQGILDKIPSLYGVSAKQLRESNRQTLVPNGSHDLVAHVRRGYDEKYADLKYAKNRHLPFSYFSDILQALDKKESISKKLKIIIHTDLLNSPRIWTPKQDGVVDGFNKNSGLVGETKISLEAYDLSREIIVPTGYNVDIRYCDPLMQAFLDMCNAKVLIQGKSALSYLAGIVNPNLVIYPPKQSAAKLRRWKSSLDFGVDLRDPLLG